MPVVQIVGEYYLSCLCTTATAVIILIYLFCFLSTRRPPTVFELILQLWNSSDFNPVAPPSVCHFDFQMATPYSHDLVAGMSSATPQKIEDRLTSMRVRVLCFISRWEQSGQGEGGTDDQEEELPDHVNVEAKDDDTSHAASSLGDEPQRCSPSSSSSFPSTGWGGLRGLRLVRSKADRHS